MYVMILKIRNRIYHGPAMTATRCTDFSEEVRCARTEQLGNLIYLYDSSGYVIRCVSREEILEVGA